MTRVACIGECMIELKQASRAGSGLYSRGFGGDTLNTAVYLARLGVAVDYVTALGDDPLSAEMIAGWQAEGVGTAKVARLPGKLPGLYLIMTDAKGERRFFHWRESAAAREPARSARDRKPAAIAVPATISSISPRSRSRSLPKAGEGGCWRRCGRRARAARASPSTPIFAPAAGPISTSRVASSARPSRRRISRSPRPRICCRFTRAKARMACSRRYRAGEAVLKLAEPVSLVRVEGVSQRIEAEPVTRRGGHHRSR